MIRDVCNVYLLLLWCWARTLRDWPCVFTSCWAYCFPPHCGASTSVMMRCLPAAGIGAKFVALHSYVAWVVQERNVHIHITKLCLKAAEKELTPVHTHITEICVQATARSFCRHAWSRESRFREDIPEGSFTSISRRKCIIVVVKFVSNAVCSFQLSFKWCLCVWICLYDVRVLACVCLRWLVDCHVM